MKKGKEQDKKPLKKQGRPLKDIVPATTKPTREMIPLSVPDNVNKEFFSEYELFEIFPEWPGNEVANVIKLY